MPQAAIMPIMAAGTAASGVGSILGARSAGPKMMATPPPAPIFPWLNKQYTGAVSQGGQQGMSSLQDMSKTGMPVNVMDSFQAMMDASGRMRSQGRANIMETLGSQGVRYGSGTNQAVSDFETQSNKDLVSTLSEMMRSSMESAANRRLESSSVLAQLFSGAGMAMAPTSTLVGGTPSATGAGLGSFGSGIEMLAMLRSMNMLGGGAGASPTR